MKKKKNNPKEINKRKRLNGGLGGDIAIFTFLSLTGIFMLLPLYLAIVNSIKPIQELFIMPPKLYVVDPTFENFTNVFKIAGNLWVPLSRYIFNSAFVTIVVVVCHLFAASTAAFVLAKCKFPGVKFLNELIVIALLFTPSVLYIMQYIVMAKLGMINSYWALILPSIATPMGLFLMRQSMGQIHDSMIEAAKVDGAGLFKTCWSIVMPNSKPAFMTLVIFAFQGAWGITGANLVYNEALKTLPTVLNQIAAAGIARQGAVWASAIILMIPPLTVFLISQSNVMETMSHSGIKD